MHRRPVAIVPRTQLTPQLAEGRIVLDLGDDRFWLLPRDLADRTLFFTMRHGVSQVESKTHRVGRRLPNVLDEERGIPRADAVGHAMHFGQRLKRGPTLVFLWRLANPSRKSRHGTVIVDCREREDCGP